MKWTLYLAACTAAFGCQVVEGDYILARELAASIPAFGALPPERQIAPAPLPGVERVFRADEQIRLAKRFEIPPPDGLRQACFTRAVQRLSPEQLQPVLREALGRDPAAIEVLDFSRQAVPQGSLEFDRAGLTPSGLWRGAVRYGEGRSTPVWARVRITDSRTGEPMQAAPAAAPYDVERGDIVRVEVRSGAVLLAFDASAETAGRLGESVLVKRASDARRFRARVETKGKVSIKK
jgi:hypothetical protein